MIIGVASIVGGLIMAACLYYAYLDVKSEVCLWKKLFAFMSDLTGSYLGITFLSMGLVLIFVGVLFFL
jgi:hypothetical protein